MSQPDVSGFETVLKTGKVQVPVKPDEGFNVEVEDQSPSPPGEDSNLDDANDNADIESAALPEKGSKSESRSIICSFLSKFAFVRPWIVILIVGALTFVVGSAVYGAYSSSAGTGNLQQQKSLAGIGGKGGKAQPPFDQLLCDTLQCGLTITDKKVILTEDLNCADNPDPFKVECAIKLDGPDAEVDCSKHMIHQATGSSWNRGICLYNGARAKNCYVQKFNFGIYIKNGGEVKDSEVMFNNNRGIEVDPQGSTTKIFNTYIHDNGGDGISINSSGGTDDTDRESLIQIQGVRSNNNGQYGMLLPLEVPGAGDITYKVKDSEASNNENDGISIRGIGGERKVDLELEGPITSRYNGGNGMYLTSPGQAAFDVTVKGVLNIYKNKKNGLASGANIVVEKGGYLNSCLNDDEDISNKGGATFGGQGTYTCGSTGANLPDCETCPSC